jgi:RNA polymerase sigma-70 factor (ECF subfamily)
MLATMAFTEAGGGAIDRPEPEALVARAALGDREAFGDLFGAYAGPVTRLCRRMLGSDEDAKDAQSEVFLRAREALAGYDPRRSFRSWLLAIAAHHCIDQLRRRAVEGRLFDAADLAEDSLPSTAPSPLGSALARERRDQVLAALDALAPRHRAPLVLRYFAELPYDAMAELLGVRARDVGVLLFRAKLRLREALSAGGLE